MLSSGSRVLQDHAQNSGKGLTVASLLQRMQFWSRQMEETNGAKFEGAKVHTGFPHPVGAQQPPITLLCSPAWKLSEPQTPSFRSFMEVPLCRHDELNHWPLVIDLTCSSSSPRSGVGLQVPTPNSPSWFLWQPAPILMLSSTPTSPAKSHLISINSGVVVRGLL